MIISFSVYILIKPYNCKGQLFKIGPYAEGGEG